MASPVITNVYNDRHTLLSCHNIKKGSNSFGRRLGIVGTARNNNNNNEYITIIDGSYRGTGTGTVAIQWRIALEPQKLETLSILSRFASLCLGTP
jgi:hypothetical protein